MMRLTVTVTSRLVSFACGLTLVLLLIGQGSGRAETINPVTWAPSGSGAYFFDRSNQTGNQIRDFSARERLFGRKFDGHLYYLEHCDVTRSMLNGPHWSLVRDRVPFVVLSWCGGHNPDSIIPQIAAGRLDKAINDFAASVKARLASHGHVFIRPFWEFNYTGSEWSDIHYGGNPQTFIAAWRRVVDLFRRHGLSDRRVKFIWSPNRTGGQSQNPVPYYPGSRYVDWIGIDAYPKHRFLTLQQLVTTGGGFDWYARFRSYGKPLMVSETGIRPTGAYGSGAPTRAQWWADLVSELRGPLRAIKAVEYFDSSPGVDWGYTAPDSTPGDGSAQAFAAARAAAHSCVLDVLAARCTGGQ
ncbi:MAG TPA: glycosyl hydrolase [Solirubrobacteraceae bacterium]|nr:glycosyl hydrolase [Solirubrobacteraceae bacterium]